MDIAVTERELSAAGVRMRLTAATHQGMRYRANFDVLHVSDRLVTVADGMGGGEGSAVAGRTAVDVVAAALAGGPVTPRRLLDAVARAQDEVGAAGQRLGELTGCTLTAFVPGSDGAGDQAAWLVHIGDSRAYRLRGGLLELLTVDHTEAFLGAVYGWYPADSPAAHSARYRLTRYVGHPARPEPDVLAVSLRPGDVYCLCTDGIAEAVSYQRLAEVLGGSAAPAQQLVADALAAGGHDNATAAVIRVS